MSSLEHASIAEAMHPGVITCPSDTSLRTVARMMAAYSVHCIVVVYEARRPIRPCSGSSPTSISPAG